jgi:pSer/pThr/pTyr-binding forkhead associated (FHA) protein
MDMKLRVDSGKNAGQEIRVPGKKFIIGRGDDCQLRAGSDMISRHHCQLVVEDSYAAVRDLGSRNGTFVNGQQITGEVQLKPGDKLRVGPLQFEIVLAAGLTGKKHPPVKGVREAAARSANSATHTEDDIAQWLMDDQTKPSPAAATQDTKQVRLTAETEEIRLGGPAAPKPAPVAQTAPAQPAPVHSDTAQSDTGEHEAKRTLFGGVAKPKKVFGKLPTTDQPDPNANSKDSREAAMRMIDQLRKKR